MSETNKLQEYCAFMAFWYKSKQDIFKEVKIQMKKKFFIKPLLLFVRFIVAFIVEFNMTLLKMFSATNLDTLVPTRLKLEIFQIWPNYKLFSLIITSTSWRGEMRLAIVQSNRIYVRILTRVPYCWLNKNCNLWGNKWKV